jgi:hypothetical protein
MSVAHEKAEISPSTLAAMELWVHWRTAGRVSSGQIGGGGGGDFFGKLQREKRRRKCPRCKGWRRIFIAKFNRNAACPRCNNAGYIWEDLVPTGRAREIDCVHCIDYSLDPPRPTGEINGVTCWRCRGSTKRTIDNVQVHPSMIAGTRLYGFQDPHPDLTGSRINAQVYRWSQDDATFWWHQVVLIEYDQDYEIDPGRAWARFTPPPAGRTKEQKALALGISPSFYSRTLKAALLQIQQLLLGTA